MAALPAMFPLFHTKIHVQLRMQIKTYPKYTPVKIVRGVFGLQTKVQA